MKRLPVYLALLVLLAVIVVAGGWYLPTSGTGSGPDSTTITDYRADFRVDADGELHATETLTVSFPAPRHGIFRFFDRLDPNAPRARRVPHDVSVTRDGSPEEYDVVHESRGRYTTLKIGDPGLTIEGTHTYVIRYTMADALLPVDGGRRSRFFWDLVPAGWQVGILHTHLTVTLPAATSHVGCAVGAGASGGCTAAGEGSPTLDITTGTLPQRTPVTVRTDVALPAPARQDGPPWPARYDGILSGHVAIPVLALLLGLVAAALGLQASRSTRERSPAFPLMYAPPDGMGPAQALFLLREKLDDKAFVGSLMHAAEHGLVALDVQDDAWTVSPKGSGDGAVDEVTRSVVAALCSGGPFTTSRKDVAAGRELKSVLSGFRTQTRAWATGSRLMVTSGVGGAGLVVVGAAFVLAGVVAFTRVGGGSIWAIVPGLFGILGYELALTGSGTMRTAQGRDVWSRVGGFHRILSTPSAEARFDFAGRKDLYTAYLPWAVAFGCADAWAKKYRAEMGQEPPVPSYWAGYYGGVHSGGFVDQMVASFDSTVHSAISSYEATQRASHSGGGGFGGGGGGGGGGGSW